MGWPKKKAAAKHSKSESAVKHSPITKDNPLYDVMQSDTCRCGTEKKPGSPLCPKCYYNLPKGNQKDFYAFKDNADAYQQAYDQAGVILDFIADHPPVSEQVPMANLAE